VTQGVGTRQPSDFGHTDILVATCTDARPLRWPLEMFIRFRFTDRIHGTSKYWALLG